MTSESERGSSDPNDSNEATPALTNTQANSIPNEGSPETLRWRADSLLDEMMLGAVDVSAADSSASAQNGRRPSTPEETHSPEGGGGGQAGSATGGSPSQPANGDYAYSVSVSDTHADDRPRVQFGDAEPALDPGRRQNGYDTAEASAQPAPTPEWRVKSGSGSSRGNDSVWSDYVSSFRSQSEMSAPIQKWQPDSPADGHDWSAPGPAGAESAESGTTGSGVTAYGGSSGGSYGGAQHGGDRDPVGPSGARDDDRGGGYVSAMSVMSSGPRRSSLLPRMSRFDVDALDREIAELHEEIRVLLPVGHDQAERARHLLDKANTIAQSDAERSAEVEYYMQQVRTIVERTRQARRWSNLYRDRLRIYLLAWTLLSSLVLTALLLFQFQVEAYVFRALEAATDGLLMRNFAGALGSMMAGALGGALGALLNMRRHTQTQYGFFDRKYGLRGLILPIIGALVGVVVYAVFGIVYYFAGINPSLSAVAMALPALIAFVFGFSQESIYGTNG